MMYQHLDAPYYDDEMELDDPGYYDAEEELYHEATRPYRWVRPGYGNHRLSANPLTIRFPVPPGEKPTKKTELQERQEEIDRLKNEIAEKEKRLKLAHLQREIQEIRKALYEKEEIAQKRQVRLHGPFLHCHDDT